MKYFISHTNGNPLVHLQFLKATKWHTWNTAVLFVICYKIAVFYYDFKTIVRKLPVIRHTGLLRNMKS